MSSSRIRFGRLATVGVVLAILLLLFLMVMSTAEGDVPGEPEIDAANEAVQTEPLR